MKKILKLLCLGLMWLCSDFVAADSDGYYCHGKDYLAYEFDGSITGKDKGHNLYIHFLSDDSSLDKPVTVKLDDFQTHGMRCSENEIVIRAWEAEYTVGLKSAESPKITGVETTQNENDQPLAGMNSSNLGANVTMRPYASDEVFPIKSTSRKYRYFLEINVVADNQVAEKGYIFYHITSQLVRRDFDDRIVGAYEIFKGVREGSVH